MILGTSEIIKHIEDGVVSRFDKNGNQIDANKFDDKNVATFDQLLSKWRWPLIQDLGEDFKIEGATVDLRLKEVFKHNGGAKLLLNQRNTGDIIETFPVDNIFTIQPKQVYLVSTFEKVNMPNYLIAYISRRTTMFRSGISLEATYTNPGYYGKLTFMMFNNTNDIIEIEKGFRIAQIAFERVNGDVSAYHGNWQGGKIHTNNEFNPAR